MMSSRIDGGMRVPLGSPNLAALASSSSGIVGAVWLFVVVFFGIGDEVDDFDGVDGDLGDDGVEFFRGMEAYTVLAAGSFSPGRHLPFSQQQVFLGWSSLQRKLILPS